MLYDVKCMIHLTFMTYVARYMHDRFVIYGVFSPYNKDVKINDARCKSIMPYMRDVCCMCVIYGVISPYNKYVKYMLHDIWGVSPT
jgi:hypothetical protein